MSSNEPYQETLERATSFLERAYRIREGLDIDMDMEMQRDDYEYYWLVRDENGDLMGLIDFDREDTAAECELYENGDGGVLFEEGYEIHVSLAWWPTEADTGGDT